MEVGWEPQNWLAIKFWDCVLDHQVLKELEAKNLRRNLIKNAYFQEVVTQGISATMHQPLDLWFIAYKSSQMRYWMNIDFKGH